MKAIYVSVNGIDYARAIVKGYKKLETRSRDMLGSLVGERVAIIRTRKGHRALVVGYATISGEFFCPASAWDGLRKYTLVPEGSMFDCHGRGKWCYRMSEPEVCDPFCPTVTVNHGRAWCEIA